MAEQADYFYFLKELFPTDDAELMRLLQGAAENAALLRSDFYTVRDWVEMCAGPDLDVLHALLLLMLVALEEGSLCLEISTPALLRRLADLVPDAEAAQRWAERIQRALDQHGFPALIGTSPLDHKPIILHKTGSERFCYFQKYLRAEMEFQRSFSQRLQHESAAPAVDWSPILRQVFRTQPFPLDGDQQFALGTALLSPLAIISGGPGTGKTSIVLTLLRCLVRGGYAAERIALAAPTGRAAQRLSDALRTGLNRLTESDSADAGLSALSATTLHQMLGYRPLRNLFSRHAENPVPADVVIVDEISMVGLVMMSQLMQALAPQTKLILLGDKDQLPSVEAGAVLATLVPDGRSNGFHGDHAERLAKIFPDLECPQATKPSALQNRLVLLQTNHRSQQAIRTAAVAINRQDASVVERLPALQFPAEPALSACWQNLEQQGGCWLLEQTVGTPQELRNYLQHWAEQAYFRSRLDGTTLAELVQVIELADPAEETRLPLLFALLDRFRLLTLVRESAWGCTDVNRYLDQYLRPKLGGDANCELFAGAPVLITRNDSTRGLNNGDVGITLRQRGGGLRVLFQRQDNYLAIPVESLPAHELGFALTVHKSQGSEYAHVMVVLPPTGGKRLLSKELIYTAITRAKMLAILCSTEEVLKSAIERRIVRESGLLRF